MTTTFLNSSEDLQWLSETHLPSLRIDACAAVILHGNEDCPQRIEVYARNHYQCVPTVFELVGDGYQLVSQGEYVS
jgi:hypothetical protein